MKAKLLFLFAICTLCTMLSYGQSNCYQVNPISYTPFSVTSGTPVSLGDDNHSGVIPIGFEFCFFGNTYNQLVVASNGYVTFDLNQANEYSPWNIVYPIPDSILPTNSIMGAYMDIDPGDGGRVSYKTVDIAPFRKFIVDYSNIPAYGSSCIGDSVSMQIVLHETSNFIDVYLENKPVCNWNNGVAIEGIQNIDGTEGYVVPGRNYPTQWTASLDAYRFTPLCACAGPTQFNVISGHVYNDITQDCVFDPSETISIPTRVCLNDTNTCIYTDATGYYWFTVDTGTYTVISDLPNSSFAYECPSNGQQVVHFNTLDSQVVVNFGDTTLVSNCADLETEIALPYLWQGNATHGAVTYCNNGALVAINTTLSIQANTSYPIIDASAAYTHNGNGVYIFDLGTLQPGECDTINFTTLPSGSLPAGEVKCYTANIISQSPECNLFDNNSNDCHTVVSNVETVSKRVLSSTPFQNGYVVADTISPFQTLEYLIVFRNSGNSPVPNVVINDTLDPHLNPVSITPGISSHPYTHNQIGELSIFTFDNINLTTSSTSVASSAGFVRFTVNQMMGNEPGTHIYNKATCLFVPNDVFTTNTTDNLILHGVGIEATEVKTFLLYPNPTGEGFYISTPREDSYTVSFIDLMGKTIRTESFNGNNHYFERNGLESGVYLLNVSNSAGERLQTLRVAIK